MKHTANDIMYYLLAIPSLILMFFALAFFSVLEFFHNLKKEKDNGNHAD